MKDDSLFSLLTAMWFAMPIVVIAFGYVVGVGWSTVYIIKSFSNTSSPNKGNPKFQ